MKVRSSSIILLLAATISAVAHITGLTALWKERDVEIEGGAPASVARLGNSFRDITQGEMVPEPATDVDLEVQPEKIETATVEPTEATHPVEIAPVQGPMEKTEASPSDVQPAQSIDAAAQPSAPNKVQALQTTAPLRRQVIAAQPTPAPSRPLVTKQAIETEKTKPVALQPIAPEQPETTEQVAEKPDTLAALENPDGPAPRISQRPPKPPVRQATKNQPKPDPAPKPQNRVPQGNAQQNETAGSNIGRENTSTNQAAEKPSRNQRQAGNAAASNYPGIVIRKIQRRKSRTNIRGVAVVTFAIAPNGALARVSVVQSSGSATLDKIAVDAVRRAAPFPPPPVGAKVSFRLSIKGR